MLSEVGLVPGDWIPVSVHLNHVLITIDNINVLLMYYMDYNK